MEPIEIKIHTGSGSSCYSEGFRLSSGREISANFRVIGLMETDDGLVLTEGFDGRLDEYNSDSMTSAENAEIADYMISLWQLFRDQQGGTANPQQLAAKHSPDAT